MPKNRFHSDGRVNVSRMCKSFLQVAKGYSDADFVNMKSGTRVFRDYHNLMNVFRKSRIGRPHRGSVFQSGPGMEILEMLSESI